MDGMSDSRFAKGGLESAPRRGPPVCVLVADCLLVVNNVNIHLQFLTKMKRLKL